MYFLWTADQTDFTDPYCRLAVANDVLLWEGRNAIRIFNPNISYFNYGSSVCQVFDTTPLAPAAGWLVRLLLLPSCHHVCTTLTLAVSHLVVTSTVMCKASKVANVMKKLEAQPQTICCYAAIYHTLQTDTVQGWPARRLSTAAIL